MHDPHPAAPRPAADESLLRRMRLSATERPAWRLTASYVVCLGLIGVLTAASWFLVRDALAEQRGDGAVVNVAGRQRMLSQKIAKAAGVAGVPGGGLADPRQRAAAEAELREAVRAFRAGHRALRDGDPALGVPAAADPEAVARLGALGPSLEALAGAAEAILAGGDPAALLPVVLAEQNEFYAFA